MTEHSGSGDPGRTLELLWGIQPRGTRGRKPGLTIERIVSAAIALADAEGLAALSMRRMADELGVGAMTLYRYVPGKAELLDLMVDTVYGETARPVGVPGDWRNRLERIARENRAMYQRHPWLLAVATSRPPLGPNLMAKYEYELSVVEGTGLSDVEMDAVIALVDGQARDAVRRAVDAIDAIKRSGITDEQWWHTHAPILEQISDAARFPLASRVGTTVGQTFGATYDTDHAFEFGLETLLNGIAMLLPTPGQRPTDDSRHAGRFRPGDRDSGL